MTEAGESTGWRFEEFPRRRDLERGSKLLDRLEAHVAFTALSRPDVGAVKARQFAQILLRKVRLLPVPSEVLGEDGDEGYSSDTSAHSRRA